MEEVNGSGGLEQTEVASTLMEENYPKEHVTQLIKKEKEAAYRKAQREFQGQLDQLKTGQTQSMGGMQQLNTEDVENRVVAKLQEQIQAAQEEHRKSEYNSYVNDQVKTYLEKMDKGSGLADDFKEMTAKFKPEKFKEVFYLANSFENTPAIIYELAKNPHKLAMIDHLTRADPDFAREQLASIAKSIQQNEHAKQNNVSAEPPLSRPKPSLAAGAGGGEMTLADLKKAPWLRG
jgi:hypothetical protein